MSLAKLIVLLQSNELNLTRLDRMPDSYEGTVTPRTAKGIDRFLKNMGSERGFHELTDLYTKSRSSTFISCWHANEHESEAMWRLYATSGGVAVQSTYAKLTESIEHLCEVYLGLVSYVDYETASFPDANLFYPVMHKRESFSHEREVRLVRYWGEPPEPDSVPANLTMPWDVVEYCEGIFVDPYAPSYYYDAVQAVLQSMKPILVPRLQWSRMKAAPQKWRADA